MHISISACSKVGPPPGTVRGGGINDPLDLFKNLGSLNAVPVYLLGFVYFVLYIHIFIHVCFASLCVTKLPAENLEPFDERSYQDKRPYRSLHTWHKSLRYPVTHIFLCTHVHTCVYIYTYMYVLMYLYVNRYGYRYV